jgi:hypothetical protein
VVSHVTRWLAQDRIAPIPDGLSQPRTLTMSGSQRNVLWWFAIVVLPGACFAAAARLVKKRTGTLKNF